MTRHIFVIAIPLFLFISCGPSIVQQRQNISAAHIGCSPEKIDIRDGKMKTWKAVCNGKTFYCTVAPQAACKEEMLKEKN